MSLYSQENLEKLLHECYSELEKELTNSYYGFVLEKEKITIKSGKTTGKRLGQIKYNNIKYSYKTDWWGSVYRRSIESIGSFEITIFEKENRDEKGVKETIMHELIHTQKDCQNHKAEFQRWCNIIYNHLGYSCWSGQHEDVKNNNFVLNNYKYFNYCPHCNKITAYGNRMTKRFKEHSGYICLHCKTSIKPITKEEIILKGIKVGA